MNIPVKELCIGLGWVALIGVGGLVLAWMNYRGGRKR